METGVRIGELARRAGITPDRLRSWERRYGLLSPARTASGYRLYGPEDERRLLAMQRALSQGFAPAEAARRARNLLPEPRPDDAQARDLANLREDLRRAMCAFDGVAAHAVLDRMFDSFTLEVVLRDGVLPYLRALGEDWRTGAASVGQEHFASNLIEARLLALARGWELSNGPAAVLACAPGERHSLGLLCFGLAIRNRGWAVLYLGSDCPVGSAAEAAEVGSAQIVVMTATNRRRMARSADELRELAATRRVLVAGAGATSEFADSVGAECTDLDPVELAARF